MPDVLADADSNSGPSDDKHRARPASLEIAVLVENTVVGQVVFVVDAGQGAIMNYCSSVIQVVLGIHKANDGC
jgi:hypothetical protein